jgi:serine/threonine protein kinase
MVDPFGDAPVLPSILEAGYVVGGRYELTRQLGRGAVARLWVARDTNDGSEVAVKVLRRDASSAHLAHRGKRLEREAVTTQRLDHPAIVRAHDFGMTAQGEPYLVMELLDGDDLVHLMDERGYLMAKDAVRLLLPIADALALAHEHDVVHRDVKPSNIVFARDGDERRAKLIDFGLVKLLGDAEQLTAAGVPIGSPAYMSPEQALGKPVDATADAWALCVVLYESITGVLPFDGDDHLQLRIAILDETAKTLMDHGIAEPELWSIIERAFEKRSVDRWPSMGNLRDALTLWLGDAGSQ